MRIGSKNGKRQPFPITLSLYFCLGPKNGNFTSIEKKLHPTLYRLRPTFQEKGSIDW